MNAREKVSKLGLQHGDIVRYAKSSCPYQDDFKLGRYIGYNPLYTSSYIVRDLKSNELLWGIQTIEPATIPEQH